jgi:hypothetical protein
MGLFSTTGSWAPPIFRRFRFVAALDIIGRYSNGADPG